jgi:hypothetical protein
LRMHDLLRHLPKTLGKIAGGRPCAPEGTEGASICEQGNPPSTAPSLPTDAHSTPRHVTQVVESEDTANSVPERGKRDHYDGL